MNDNQKIICGIFILLCLGLIGAMEASIHVNSEDVIERHQEPVNINGDLYVLDPYFVLTIGEPQYYLNSTQVHQVAEKDIYGNPIFWIDETEYKKIWILLPNSTGHMMAYVEDIDNLIETSNYTFTDVYVRKLEYSNYTEVNGTVFINDTDVYMEVSPGPLIEGSIVTDMPEAEPYIISSSIPCSEPYYIKTTEDILSDHNFSNWSVEDQRLLTDMMRVTVRQMLGASDISEFSVLAEAAPGHVLEAYIDLLENLGY